MGINTATAPIWQTETSQTKWRGKLVILDMMMNIAGFCLVNWINYGLAFAGGSVSWRFPLERTAVGKGVLPIETAEHVEWTDAERKR